MTTRQPRPFTGRQFATILCAMFAVVMAVNFTMATLASRTFSGAVVQNGYVANQDFNAWIERGKRQAQIGWAARAEVKADSLSIVATDRTGAPLTGATVSVHLIHPFRAGETRWIYPVEAEPGTYVAAHSLTRGQWEANIRLEREGEVVMLRQRLYVSQEQAS